MNLDQIIEYALPETFQERKCAIDMQKLKHKREKVKGMIKDWAANQFNNAKVLEVEMPVKKS